MRDIREDQKDIEEACVIGHKNIGALRIETLKPLNLHPKSSEGKAGSRPIDKTPVSVIAVAIKETGNIAPDPAK
jgi:hypothetical protein